MDALKRMSMALGIVTTIGAPAAVYFDGWDIPLKISGLYVVAWLLWLTLEIVSLRTQATPVTSQDAVPVSTLPRPIVRQFNDEPVLIHSRNSSDDGDIPHIESQFLDCNQCTFCMWVEIKPHMLSELVEPKYIFSHTSADDGNTYPDSFSLLITGRKPKWRIMFHGDPEFRKPAQERREFPSLMSDVGTKLFTVRWSKTRGDVEVLIDCKKRLQLDSITNWPSPVACPVFLGGWVRGGWSSYIGAKVFDLQVFDIWLTDEQLHVILAGRPRL